MQRNFSVNMTTTPTIRGDAKAPELNEETDQAAMELFVLWSINSSRNSHFQIWLSGATVARLIPACGMQRFLSGVSRRLSVRIGSRSFFFFQDFTFSYTSTTFYLYSHDVQSFSMNAAHTRSGSVSLVIVAAQRAWQEESTT